MIPHGNLRSVGWAAILVVCITLFVVLTFRVNAVKSEVRLAERRIVSLERQKLMLETEFQTRASQQQLANWNEVDFGYRAPGAGQFIENERQLAQLGAPRAPGAPTPIRVASAVSPESDGNEQGFPQFVSPLTGKPLVAELEEDSHERPASSESLSGRLTNNAARIVLSARMEAGE